MTQIKLFIYGFVTTALLTVGFFYVPVGLTIKISAVAMLAISILTILGKDK